MKGGVCEIPADVTSTDQDRDRYSARRKTKAILRLLRGEDIDVISRELGVTAATPRRGLSTYV